MGSYGKICIIFLWILNILFVSMGYVGIAKMVRQDAIPFHQGPSMLTMIYIFYVIPDRLLLFWNSGLGHVVVWSGCILLPVTGYFLFTREKFLAGFLTLLLSIVPFGIVGFLIWLHTFVDLPHD